MFAVAGWTVFTVLYSLTTAMTTINSEVNSFLDDARRDFLDAISQLDRRSAALSSLKILDADESAAVADALAALVHQKRALEESSEFISKFEDAIQVLARDRDRFQSKMDSLARKLYEIRDRTNEEFDVAETSMIELEIQLGIDISSYIDLVKSALIASTKANVNISKRRDFLYPNEILKDDQKALFSKWRALFVRTVWEFPEIIEGYETCLDMIDFLEKRLEGETKPDYEYLVEIDNNVYFQYSNASDD